MDLFAVIYNKLIYRPFARQRLRQVGCRFRLGYSSELLHPELFSIGNNFFTGPHCYLATNEFSPVRIGADVMFGPHCKLIGGNHDYTYTKGAIALNKFPRANRKEIIIENGVWVGASTVILTGAHIGEGAVIGAMGLVSHFAPPYTIAVGVPAKRFISRFADDEDLVEVLRNVGSSYTVEKIRRVQKEHVVEVRVAR